MPKIVINEIDETTPGASTESFEVVYIPGCVDSTLSELWYTDPKTSVNTYIGIEVNKPTLFTSVRDFESMCGAKGLTFEEDVYYKDLATDESFGFSKDAVPLDGILFSKGTIDPGYVMAKELLASGLNVLFERINNDENYKVTTIDRAKSDKYYAELPTLHKVTDVVAPTLGLFRDSIVTTDAESTSTSSTSYVYSVYEVNRSSDTQPKEGIQYYTKDSITYNGKQTLAYISVDGEFIPNTEYFTKGRAFYTVGSDDTTINNVVYTSTTEGTNQPRFYNTLKGYVVIDQIPADWNTKFNNYLTVEEVLQEIPADAGEEISYAKVDNYINTNKIKVEVKVGGLDISSIYNALMAAYDSTRLNGLADKGNYSIKYLTSGGYPVFEYRDNIIANAMIKLSKDRGDCVAIIDHTDNEDRQKNIGVAGSLFKEVATANLDDGEYATMFTPWATYVRKTLDKERTAQGDLKVIENQSTSVRMPASYAYLNALADSIKTNASWLAVAGTARGLVRSLAAGGMSEDIPNGAADAMQPRQGIAINPITNIKPYGYTIWGNRTLKKNDENLTATSFLNIRNLVSDVKKTCYRAARSLTFEQNNEVLWVNFKSKIAPTLDRMLSGYGISGYKIVRDTENEKVQEKATVCAKIIIYPTYAVEDFYITIVLRDDEISVESGE